MRPQTVVTRSPEQLDPDYPEPFSFTEEEKATFDGAVRESEHYLEFGMGGSTIRALQISKAMVYSVESSPEWIERLRKFRVIRDAENKRLRIFPMDIGPTLRWGFPEENGFKERFAIYSSKVFQCIDSQRIDLVLVDGRFRVACVLKTVLACHENPGIKILIHDFWNRPHYQLVLGFLDTVKRADTVGLFSIKKDLDLNLIENCYEEYKFDPR